MKLLGWMHRKFRQNSNEPLKNFAIGQTSFNEQQYYQRPSFGHKPYWQTQTGQLRKSFAGLETSRVEEEEDYDESSEEISDLFHGFLAIGTLGSDPNLNDPSTPEFAQSVENITEKETEVTESELQLINDELEKVLCSEVKEDDSSGRNSHVSNGRSSYGSTITLSGKPFTDVTDGNGNGNGSTVCPLRGYLFGSAVEMSETTKMVGKRENRMSLGELFQKTKMGEENMGEKYERDDRRTEKEGDYNRSAVHLMKKLLRKKLHHGSRNLAAVAGGTGDSGTAEKKLHKILHMFNKKVHPETTEKMSKNLNKKNTSNYHVGPEEDEEDLMTLPERFLSKERVRRYKSQSCLSDRLADSNWNKECWIKTDADYLVLEL